MVVEVWEWDEPWPISFPEEPLRDRYLVVWNSDGTSHGQAFRHNGKAWIGFGTFGYGLTWPRIAAWCMEEDLTLTSLPPETGDSQ